MKVEITSNVQSGLNKAIFILCGRRVGYFYVYGRCKTVRIFYVYGDVGFILHQVVYNSFNEHD